MRASPALGSMKPGAEDAGEQRGLACAVGATTMAWTRPRGGKLPSRSSMRCGVAGAERVIAITSSGVRADDDELAAWYRLLVRPLLKDTRPTRHGADGADILNAELEWCFVRPVFLTDREGEGHPYRRCADTGRWPDCESRCRLAPFIVGEIESPPLDAQAPTLAV